jgi:hypothetical protein
VPPAAPDFRLLASVFGGRRLAAVIKPGPAETGSPGRCPPTRQVLAVPATCHRPPATCSLLPAAVCLLSPLRAGKLCGGHGSHGSRHGLNSSAPFRGFVACGWPSAGKIRPHAAFCLLPTAFRLLSLATYHCRFHPSHFIIHHSFAQSLLTEPTYRQTPPKWDVWDFQPPKIKISKCCILFNLQNFYGLKNPFAKKVVQFLNIE